MEYHSNGFEPTLERRVFSRLEPEKMHSLFEEEDDQSIKGPFGFLKVSELLWLFPGFVIASRGALGIIINGSECSILSEEGYPYEVEKSFRDHSHTALRSDSNSCIS